MFTYAKDRREYEKQSRKKKPVVIDTEDHQTKYVKTILDLKAEGYIDKRQVDKICYECGKLCIRYEEIEHVLGLNEVFASHNQKDHKIY